MPIDLKNLSTAQIEGGRPCGQGKGLLGADGGNQGVSGEGGEVVEKSSEAVDLQRFLERFVWMG
jgi:hypothetical protein